MTRILTSFLLTLFVGTTSNVFAQVDTAEIKNFIQKTQSVEEKFITLLKNNKIDDCLKYFSAATLRKYGSDSIRKELTFVSNLFSKYKSPKASYSLGENFHGIGTFGHDSEGKYEKQSLYQFMDGDNEKYFLTLYFNDGEPVDLIKYYDSQNFQEPYLKTLKPIRPILAPATKEN